MTFIFTLIIGMMIGGCLALVIMGFCFMSKDSDYRERIMTLEYQLRKAGIRGAKAGESLHRIIKNQEKREGIK